MFAALHLIQPDSGTNRLLLRTITEADTVTIKELDVTEGDFESVTDVIKWICWVKQAIIEVGRVYIYNKYEFNGEVEIVYGTNEEHHN